MMQGELLAVSCVPILNHRPKMEDTARLRLVIPVEPAGDFRKYRYLITQVLLLKLFVFLLGVPRQRFPADHTAPLTDNDGLIAAQAGKQISPPLQYLMVRPKR